MVNNRSRGMAGTETVGRPEWPGPWGAGIDGQVRPQRKSPSQGRHGRGGR